MKNRIYKVMEAFKQGEEIKTYDMEVKGQWLTYNGANKPVVTEEKVKLQHSERGDDAIKWMKINY